jgi:hypothetical protein
MIGLQEHVSEPYAAGRTGLVTVFRNVFYGYKPRLGDEDKRLLLLELISSRDSALHKDTTAVIKSSYKARKKKRPLPGLYKA